MQIEEVKEEEIEEAHVAPTTMERCKLQLFFDEEQDKLFLRKRDGKFLKTDDDDSIRNLKGVYTEVNFTDLNQKVEQSVINLFGISDNESHTNSSDLHFLGPLAHFNLLFIHNSWVHKPEDLLKLPAPEIERS